jgi:hypothetical protein
MLRVVFRAAAWISFAALLLSVHFWIRSYRVNDSIWQFYEPDADEQLGRYSRYGLLWSSRGGLAFSRGQYSLRDRAPLTSFESQKEAYAASLHMLRWQIDHSDTPQEEDALAQCLATSRYGFGLGRYHDESPFRRYGRTVGIVTTDATAVGFPYWCVTVALALLPAAAVARRVQAHRRRAREQADKSALRRAGGLMYAMFSISAAASMLLLVITLVGWCATRWVSGGMSDSRTYAAEQPEGSRTCSCFYMSSAYFYRGGFQLRYAAPDLTPPAPWQEDARSVVASWGGSSAAPALYTPGPWVEGVRLMGGELITARVPVAVAQGSGLPPVAMTERILLVPYWLIALTSACVPAVWVQKRRRRQLVRARTTAGLCRSCGYDMRATPDRCPECGFIPPSLTCAAHHVVPPPLQGQSSGK